MTALKIAKGWPVPKVDYQAVLMAKTQTDIDLEAMAQRVLLNLEQHREHDAELTEETRLFLASYNAEAARSRPQALGVWKVVQQQQSAAEVFRTEHMNIMPEPEDPSKRYVVSDPSVVGRQDNHERIKKLKQYMNYSMPRPVPAEELRRPTENTESVPPARSARPNRNDDFIDAMAAGMMAIRPIGSPGIGGQQYAEPTPPAPVDPAKIPGAKVVPERRARRSIIRRKKNDE